MTSLHPWMVDALLLVALGVAWRFPNKGTIAVASTACLAVACFREIALASLGRALVQARFHEGRWSPAYGEGVVDFKLHALVWSRTSIVIVVGLVVLILRLAGRSGQSAKGPARPE